jgi:hypothetical protein
MDHTDIRHRLSEYLDDAVTAEERTVIDTHLAACTECSDALRELRKTIEHLRAVEEIEPPAWMVQRVMARVREESARGPRRWSFFDRFAMLRPVRVLAVLALTVTAYYIYLNLEPSGRHAAPPAEIDSGERAAMDRPAGMEDRATGAGRKAVPERSAGRVAPSSKKDLLQSPAYRSLDMKYSYEQPPAPEPVAPPEADAARPMVAKKEAALSRSETGASSAIAPPAAAPLAERARESGGRSESKVPAAQKGPLQLKLETGTVASTAARSAKAVTDLGGRIIKVDIVTNAHIITADIPTDALAELVKRLRTLGTLRDLSPLSVPPQQRTLLEVMVMTPSARPAPQNE